MIVTNEKHKNAKAAEMYDRHVVADSVDYCERLIAHLETAARTTPFAQYTNRV